MSNDVKISLSITPTWSILKDVREKTEKFVKSKGVAPEIIEATIMCASELVENAIKYGSDQPDNCNINFDLRAENNKIIVQVSNGIKEQKDVNSVVEHITKISNSDDPSKLYTERLMELMENPKPGISQLGLYRISYEGQFILDSKVSDSMLTIIAERNY